MSATPQGYEVYARVLPWDISRHALPYGQWLQVDAGITLNVRAGFRVDGLLRVDGRLRVLAGNFGVAIPEL